MNRNFPPELMRRVVKDSVEVGTDLLPYYCIENERCWSSIKSNIQTVKKYDITPEKYWHDNEDAFKWLLALLSDYYPSPEHLLSLAEQTTGDEIISVVAHYCQRVDVMFEHVKIFKGYDVLRPTDYMLLFYPNAKGMLYVYTNSVWANRKLNHIDGEFLIFPEERLPELNKLFEERFQQVISGQHKIKRCDN